MFQTTPCGYSKLVSQDAWYNAKGFSSIRASCPEKTSKKWSDIAHLSDELNMSIFRNILGVFSALDARIKLIPFALYQAPWDTSLEYPHEVVWNILKINFLARATEGTSLYVWVRQSVSQLVSVCVSVFQNSYQGTSRLCRELRFCLELVHTS